MEFTPRTFDIPELPGISKKNIEEHIKLYLGYVKNANNIIEKIKEYTTDGSSMLPDGKNGYITSELQRRFGFEFNGMRNHEYFFAQFEGGAHPFPGGTILEEKIIETWGSIEKWMDAFKNLALTRGIGWAILYFDPETKRLLHAWVDEQHFGQLVTCQIILALDMWEHAYVYDYSTSEKKKYIEAFFANINWNTVVSRISI